jgi:hypothetical protein
VCVIFPFITTAQDNIYPFLTIAQDNIYPFITTAQDNIQILRKNQFVFIIGPEE